jgi:hypothetical protein
MHMQREPRQATKIDNAAADFIMSSQCSSSVIYLMRSLAKSKLIEAPGWLRVSMFLSDGTIEAFERRQLHY